jgi:hypothetical protein
MVTGQMTIKNAMHRRKLKRRAEIIDTYIEQLGGSDVATAGQETLIKCIASVQMMLERYEAANYADDDANADQFARLAQILARLLYRAGLIQVSNSDSRRGGHQPIDILGMYKRGFATDPDLAHLTPEERDKKAEELWEMDQVVL